MGRKWEREDREDYKKEWGGRKLTDGLNNWRGRRDVGQERNTGSNNFFQTPKPFVSEQYNLLKEIRENEF